MSRGSGWIEREIFKALEEIYARPVFYLAWRCHMLKCKKYKDINLYKSVCRTVRRLEKKHYLKSKKISIKELDENYFRYTKYEHGPTYVKLVWLDIQE